MLYKMLKIVTVFKKMQ